MAIAGALVAGPQAQHAFARPLPVASAQISKPATASLARITTHTSIARSVASTRHAAARAAARSTSYKVRTGDTLSGIAERYYHNSSDWPWLYHENAKSVRDPNLIYSGETLLIPANAPTSAEVASYVPRHARPAAHAVRNSTDGVGAQAVTHHSAASSSSHSGSHTRDGGPVGSGGSGSGLGGTLGCSGLERLWEAAGGNPAYAFMAAEIAMAESGGNQYAHSPTDDFGYWQINASNGALATYDAYGNARSAIILSHDGTDWYPWTTYTSGAYHGRC